jgi:PKD repeat protein
VLGLSLTADPVNGSAPLEVEFYATLTPGSASGSFQWEFGDGATFQVAGGNSSSVEHRYAFAGNFTASVLVSSSGEEANASVQVTVTSSPLGATLSASPLAGTAPLTVQFAATPSGGSGTYTSVTWQFGGAGSGSGTSLRYTFSTPGFYNITLNVTDSAGASVQRTVEIHVDPASLPPVVGDSPSPYGPWVWAVALVLAATAIGLATYRYVVGRRAVPAPQVPASVLGAPLSRPPSPAPSLEPPPVGTAVVPPSPSEGSRRLSEQILVHLYWSGPPTADGVAPVAASQNGMARELGVTQNAVSKAAQRLVDSGAVTVELRHVPGAPRRLKTYQLTERGQRIARSLAFEPPSRPGS